jgi:hypothetical protein
LRIKNLLLAGASAAALAGCSGLPPIGPPSWYSQSFAVRNADGSIYDPATSPPAYAPPLYQDWPHQANLTGPEINHDRAVDNPPTVTAPLSNPDSDSAANDAPAPSKPGGLTLRGLLGQPDSAASSPPSSDDDCSGWWRICHFL